MIRSIGCMIGAYIILRCVEMLSMPKSHFRSETSCNVTQLLAVLVILWTALMFLLLMTRESGIPGLG